MSTTESAIAPTQERSGTIYNRVFWLAYLANVSLVTANALTFRFAELVAFLGGTERIAGGVVSTGVTAALVARFVLGPAIDRYGTRFLWTLATLLFTTGCVLLVMTDALSWGIYAARVFYAMGLAGMMTCAMVHIQNQVPFHRRTEIIATLGTSGFVGMIAGTQLGDVIFRLTPHGREQFVLLFGAAAVLGVLYLAVVLLMTRRDVHEPPHETPAAHRLVFRYWPGNVAFVAIMIGIGYTVVTVFLTRFATHLGLVGIGAFFAAFSISAFFFRIVSRRWSRRIGRHRLILIGLSCQVVGFALLPLVRSQWHFIIPAMGCGMGHALLFPSAVSLGAGAFPKEYRGTGTTIVLGFTEVGAMLCAPLLGWIIDTYGFTAMFLATAGTAASVGTLYALTDARALDNESATVEDKSKVHVVPKADEEIRDERDPNDSIAVPFPHLGRSA